jgi:hypothetical protein
VIVTPVDSTTGTSPITLIFDTVTAAGDTTLTLSGTGTPPPTGFKLGHPPTYYELHTTATFESSVQVCITYPATAYNNEARLKLFHREGSAWIDVTTSVDISTNVICGRITSFSAFAVLEPVYDLRGFYRPIDMGIKNSAKGGSTVPLKFEAFQGATELSDVAIIKPITQQQITCPNGTPDAIEEYATGNTNLRYDTSAGQFIYNWKTPKKPGTCYRVKVMASDGSSLEVDFVLK